MIGWNLELSGGTMIEENMDMDPQQIYENQEAKIKYGEEAK